MHRLVLGITLVFLAQACTTTAPGVAELGIKERREIRKSPNDDRNYRYLRLANDLRVVLISDLGADKAAASLTAFRGNYADPDEYPGLAHFLEHMLFIGTEKYPDPEGYLKFVQSHGGSSNAYTSTEHTNYFFDIQPAFFREGLDRFAQFFISPSFDPAYVDREKNAVDSEYRLRIKEDNWRGMMASKMAVNPAHPYGKFNIGTLDSLDENVHGALLEFFATGYSANQMGVVVLNNESLDDLESWVVPIFQDIENRELPSFTVSEPLYADGQLPAVLTHQSLRQEYSLVLSFPMPLLDTHYRKKPGGYISNLIGHEGEGSLHRALVTKGWITALSSGSQRIDNRTSSMQVRISLTPEGRNHIPEVADLFFDYVELLKRSRIERWRFAEQATVADLGFRFQDQAPSLSTVSAMSPDLLWFPPEDLLTNYRLMEEFDPELISSYLDRIVPDNTLMEIIGPDVETTEVEKFFQVGYNLERVPLRLAPTPSTDLHLPEANAFLPEDLSVGADDGAGPTIAFRDGNTEIWLDVDNEFGVPRSTINLSLRSEQGLISLDDHVMALLYRELVVDDLNTLSYPALLAGVSYSLAVPPKGFRITTSGYSDKQPVLLGAVLGAFTGLQIKTDRFEVLKSDLIRTLRNTRAELPFRQTRSAMLDIFLSSRWSPERQAEFLQTVTLGDLNAWRSEKLRALDVLAMLHGNVASEDVAGLHSVLKKHLQLGDVTVATPSVMEVDRAYLHEVEIDHNDASMWLHIQDADESFKSRARSALMTQLLNSAYFSSLRTEQQLGYGVWVLSAPMRYRGGVTFGIQSPVAAPDVLEQKTIEFVDAQMLAIEALQDAAFEEHKAGLISSLTETDKNLSQRSLRYWSDLDQGVTTFDSSRQIADEVATISKADMVTYLREIRASLDDRRLLVFNRGKFDGAPGNGAPL